MATVSDFLVDFAREESGGGGTRYTPGTYKAKIVAAKPVVSREKRTPGVAVKFKFIEGKLRGKTLTETLWASPKAFGRYRDILEAIGESVPRRVRLGRIADKLKGAELYIEVEDDTPSDGYDPKSVVAFRGFYSIDQYEEDGDDDDADDYDDYDDDEDAEDEEESDDIEEDDEDDEGDDEEDSDGFTEDDLNELSTAKLKELADEYGIDYPSRLGSRAKPKLIKQLLAAQDDEEDGEDDEEEESEPEPRRRKRSAKPAAKKRRRAPVEDDEDDDDDLDLDDY